MCLVFKTQKFFLCFVSYNSSGCLNFPKNTKAFKITKTNNEFTLLFYHCISYSNDEYNAIAQSLSSHRLSSFATERASHLDGKFKISFFHPKIPGNSLK